MKILYNFIKCNTYRTQLIAAGPLASQVFHHEPHSIVALLLIVGELLHPASTRQVQLPAGLTELPPLRLIPSVDLLGLDVKQVSQLFLQVGLVDPVTVEPVGDIIQLGVVPEELNRIICLLGGEVDSYL